MRGEVCGLRYGTGRCLAGERDLAEDDFVELLRTLCDPLGGTTRSVKPGRGLVSLKNKL